MSYTLHRGDALTVLKTIPDESVNAVIPTPRTTPADEPARTAPAVPPAPSTSPADRRTTCRTSPERTATSGAIEAG